MPNCSQYEFADYLLMLLQVVGFGLSALLILGFIQRAISGAIRAAIGNLNPKKEAT